MELRHLEQIVAIVRAGGFNGAAKSLRISQPALSKSISRLESALGVKLFERSPEGASPTPSGQFVAERAEALLNDVAALSREIEQRSRGELGRLVIAVGPVSRLKPLPEVIRHAAIAFPRLKLEICQASGRLAVQGVQQGRFDIAFSRAENAGDFPDLIRVKLFEDDIVFVARPGHPLSARAKVEPADLLRFPMASFLITDKFRGWIGPVSAAQEANLHAFVSEDPDTLRQLTLDTDAVAWGPRFVFAGELASGRLVELRCGRTWSFDCWMLTRPGQWGIPLVKKIAEFARTGSSRRP